MRVNSDSRSTPYCSSPTLSRMTLAAWMKCPSYTALCISTSSSLNLVRLIRRKISLLLCPHRPFPDLSLTIR